MHQIASMNIRSCTREKYKKRVDKYLNKCIAQRLRLVFATRDSARILRTLRIMIGEMPELFDALSLYLQCEKNKRTIQCKSMRLQVV